MRWSALTSVPDRLKPISNAMWTGVVLRAAPRSNHSSRNEPQRGKRRGIQCHSAHRQLAQDKLHTAGDSPPGLEVRVGSASAYEPFIGSNDPMATLAGDRLDSAHARDEVSSGYTDQSPGTLQDRLTVHDFLDNPLGDFIGRGGSLRLLCYSRCGR